MIAITILQIARYNRKVFFVESLKGHEITVSRLLYQSGVFIEFGFQFPAHF